VRSGAGLILFVALGCDGALPATAIVGPASIDAPAAWYPLDGTFPLGEDRSGHHADASPIKLALIDDPERGHAVHVDGGGLIMPSLLTRDFTIAFWLRTSQMGPDQPGWIEGPRLFDADIPGHALDFGIGIALDRLAFGVGVPGPDDALDNAAMKSKSPVVDGSWHHVAVTRSVTTGLRRIYVDGAFDSQADALPGELRTPVFVAVGWVTDSAPTSPPLEADLAQLVLYDRVLDEAAVAALAAR
jgi:Concanavalin A-like lectin/glucanases superfamily